MNVAAPRWKHSWILGQRADSQTVWRLRFRRPVLSSFSDVQCVRLLRAHSGSRGREATPGAALPICTRASLTLLPERVREPGVLEVRLGLAHGLRVGIRSDEDAHQAVRAGRHPGREAFVFERLI